MNIPRLSSQDSTLHGEVYMDSEVENLKIILQQHKSQIDFLNETNGRLVMTNRRLREDLEDISAHYKEPIDVSKEALKREIQNQVEDLTQQVQKLSKQNERLLNRVRSLEIEQERTKRQSHALGGIAMFA